MAAVEGLAADGPAARAPVVQRPSLPGREEAVVGVAAGGGVGLLLMPWKGGKVEDKNNYASAVTCTARYVLGIGIKMGMA